MTNEQRFKQCLEWILENIHKPFVDTSTIEHHIIHELHLAHLEDAKQIAKGHKLIADPNHNEGIKPGPFGWEIH